MITNELFSGYESRYWELTDIMQDELPRCLRLFNIRLRLSIDIQISFKGDIALTKSQEVKDTYHLIFQLLESWNAYEGLSKYAITFPEYKKQGGPKSKMYSQEFLKPVGSLEVLESALSSLKSLCDNKSGFKNDFTQYLDRLVDDQHIGPALTDDSKKVKEYILASQKISGIEVLSLIYAERNLYYHSAEAAKMGMRYSNRKALLDEYLQCLRAHTLLLASFLIGKDIARNR